MSQGKKIVLTPAQEAYLRRHFKDTDNGYLALELGISETALHRFARAWGLKKTKAHCRQMQREAAAAAKASHLANGTYPPRGYIIPGSEKYRFKPGHKEGKVAKRHRIEASAAARRKTIQEERKRIAAGKPQRTKLRLTAQPPGKIKDRCYLKSRGYILDEETATAIYTDTTRRSPYKEAAATYYKFKSVLEYVKE